MKIGDLVKMDFRQRENFQDLWGVGLVVEVEKRQATFGGTDIVVLWSKPKRLSWEMPELLELINESR